jgi:ABC-2 type transport system permease protein
VYTSTAHGRREGSVWAAVLFVLSVWWGTATFRRENA